MEGKKSYWGSYPPAGVTPSGSKVRKVYGWDESGKRLVQTGEVDIQEEINAAAVGVTPYEIMDRLAKTGDESPLHASEGFAGDVSGVPDNMADINRVVIKAKEELDQLSVKESSPVSPAPSPAPSPAVDQKPEEVKK